MALHRNIKSLKSPYAFKSYLLKIVSSVCATRNLGKRQATEQIEDYVEVLEDTSSLGPQGSLDQMELSAAIRKVVEQLSPKQREALTLRYFDDLDYEEIAQIMGITIKTVGSNIVRAKEALKRLIEKDQTEHFDDSVGPQTLRHQAIGPAISMALAQSINESVSSQSAVQVVNSVVTSIGAGAATAQVGGLLTAVKSWLLAGTAALVVIGGGVAVGSEVYQAQGDSGTTIVRVSAAAYQPHAAIEFRGGNIVSDATGGFIEQINPTSATLVLDEGSVVEWTITGSFGSQYALGTGTEVTGVFAELPPGDYTLEWIATNEDGTRAHITRTFVIAE